MTTAAPRIRLSGPASIVAAVPHLLGFRPESSVVLVCVDEETKALRLTVRVDLPGSEGLTPEWLEALIATTDHVGSVGVVLVVVDDDPATGHLPWDDVVVGFKTAMEDRRPDDVRLIDALLVRNGHWWSYLCSDPTCCPLEGTPIESPEAWRVAAEFVAEGVGVLASRAVIEQRVAARDDSLVVELTEVLQAGFADPVADVDEFVDVLSLVRVDSLDADLDIELAATALVSCREVGLRDGLIIRQMGRLERGDARDLEHVLATLCELVRVAPDAYLAPVASVVAVLAWQCGEGALASCAIDRAVEADPDYALVRLIDGMIRAGIPPLAVRTSLARLQTPTTQAS